ncbi:hypothetical protein BDV96DRAFT_149583 [Lophiotrema nucula]|uniref:F-box domain-containing protein n=1 Tax=Lophiotrema nucula TaxID=690887 RepID=A0A6A5Z2F3_9PLEO|nr:hypothetical protein BDV96DRAFT_149583 [Lophiotrema nucula]
MESLPNELLIQIAAHLDTAPPSIEKFAHEPSPQLTYSAQTPLKELSQVSWRWRKVVLPLLFQYSRIELHCSPQWISIDARLLEDMQCQLTTLSDHEMQIYTKMRSKLKSSFTSAFDEAFDDLLVNLCQIQEGDDFLKSVLNTLRLPHVPTSFTNFTRFVSQNNLKHHTKSLVIFTDQEYELRHVSSADTLLARAVAEIWSNIFDHFEPARLVVAAPPATLAGLLDVQMLSSDAWAFEMNMHYVELLQEDSITVTHSRTSQCRPWDTALIHRRPWTHLGYNEGPSIAAYSTYEYHLKQSPKILFLILVRLSKEVQSCCNIRSFSFTGIFPLSTNVLSIVRAVHMIKTLRKIQYQLAPGPENDLMSSPKRMGRAQPHDLWLEWTESYKDITNFLDYNDEDGSEFISLDCGQTGLVKEVDELMNALIASGSGWRKEGVGRWIRDCSLDEELTGKYEITPFPGDFLIV